MITSSPSQHVGLAKHPTNVSSSKGLKVNTTDNRFSIEFQTGGRLIIDGKHDECKDCCTVKFIVEGLVCHEHIKPEQIASAIKNKFVCECIVYSQFDKFVSSGPVQYTFTQTFFGGSEIRNPDWLLRTVRYDLMELIKLQNKIAEKLSRVCVS